MRKIAEALEYPLEDLAVLVAKKVSRIDFQSADRRARRPREVHAQNSPARKKMEELKASLKPNTSSWLNLPKQQKPTSQPQEPSRLVEQLVDQLDSRPTSARPIEEWKFHPNRTQVGSTSRGFQKVAVEVHGGTWVGGRHTRGAGFEKDREKMNEAHLLGWLVL